MLRYARSFLLSIFIFIFIQPIVYAEDNSLDITTNAKIVAFGDVHGAYDELVSLLKETGMIDSNLNWSGGNTNLVSLGDLIDRGPRSRDVVDLIMKLQTQAPESEGRVHVVLGNHELMEMTGDRGYIAQSDYAAFAGEETEKDREDLRQEYIKDHADKDDKNYGEEFDKLYPSGFIAYERAFSPEGYIGKWILKQPFILKINDTVFVHGGISSEIADKSLSEINKEGKTDLNNYLQTVGRLRNAGVLPEYVGFYDRIPYLNSKAKKMIDADPAVNYDPEKRPAWFNDVLDLIKDQKTLIFSYDSPVWYRGTSLCNPNCESFNTEKFLKHVKAARVVIGHTPTLNHRVIDRMDGMAVRIDTGMLHSYFKGQASALIINKDNLQVHYLGTPGYVSPDIEHYSLSEKVSGMSDSELEDFLLTGKVIDKKAIGTGITRPMKITLKKGDKTIHAVFKTYDSRPVTRDEYEDSDRYEYDVAAYRLDRMLDLQMVPPAVIREIDGDTGALQYWVENSINERDRLKDKIPFDSFCKKNEQYWLRFIFDTLIYNVDPNLTNLLWTKNGFMLILIDHTRAFRLDGGRTRQYRDVPLNVSDLLRKKLQALTVDNLTKNLSPYLNSMQIRAIITRRDLILKEANTTD